MFTAPKFAALLIALGALVFVSPLDARVNCAPRDRACQALHRPSTAAERQRTAQLNREAGEATRSPMVQSDNSYRNSQRQYQRDLREYRQAQRRYEQDTRGNRRGSRPAMRRPDSGRDDRRGGMMRPRPRPETAEELDRDPCAPTGGQGSPNILAPRTGLNGAVTGLTTFNARTNGNRNACQGPRRR